MQYSLWTEYIYKVCLTSNVTGAIEFFINNWIKNQNHLLQSNVVPLGSHTQPETLFPLLVGVLEEFMWKCPQLVCHNLLDIVYSSKNNLWGGIWVLGKGRSHTDSDQVSMGLQNHWNTFFGQNFVHGDGSVTGSVVMMQHPSVHLPSSLVKMSWTVWWFKSNPWSHESPHCGHIFFRFLCARSFKMRCLFHTLMGIQNALCHLKICALVRACST
jgi:hypothetical protein